MSNRKPFKPHVYFDLSLDQNSRERGGPSENNFCGTIWRKSHAFKNDHYFTKRVFFANLISRTDSKRFNFEATNNPQ